MRDAGRLQRIVARLQARARPVLLRELVPLQLAGRAIGLVEPAIARFIAQHVDGFTLTNGVLAVADDVLDIEALTALFALMARKLHDAGMIRGWRDEALAIGIPAIATIERAACRALGITTEAVHLNAYADAETLIVAQRASHKQIDPSLWDNLVGGMVSAGETLLQALQREATEEAGLTLNLTQVTHGRRFHVQRPVPEGLQSEIIHVYDTTLAPGTALANRDGEVAAIERRSVNEVVEAIERDQFTLESALVTLESLTRQSDGEASFFQS